MSDHAVLPPSAAHRWLRCPGSVALCAALPPAPDTVYSREGTFAHSCAADLLLGKDPADRTDGEFACDETMLGHLRQYRDVIHAIRLADDVAAEDVWIEQRVALSQSCWGTADCVMLSRANRRLHVVDLKYGAGVLVPADGNEQLMIYGAAALVSLGVDLGDVGDVDEVELHIVQPRRADAEGNVHRSVAISRRALAAFAVRTILAASAIVEGDVPDLRPGDHCMFCPGRASCPELRTLATRTMQEVVAPRGAPEPSVMTNEQCSEVLDRAEMLETWIKAVRGEVERRLLAGEPVPGRKLVEILGHSKWVDEGAAVSLLRQRGADPYVEPKLVSPAEAARRIGRGGKDAVAPLVTRPVTGLRVVHQDDKRPAVTSATAAIRVFSDLDAESDG